MTDLPQPEVPAAGDSVPLPTHDGPNARDVNDGQVVPADEGVLDLPSADPVPLPEVQAALRAALEEDPTRLGDVYRLQAEGLSPVELAERLQVPTAGFVYNYRQQIDALLEGKLPRGANLAAQTASRVRKWLRRQDWSEPVQAYLTDLSSALEEVSTDPQLVEREDTVAALKTEKAENKGIAGVYVYSLPHYLRYPYDPASRHTLFKVGRSEVDVYSRLDGQSKTTAVPEDPVLLRIYATDDSVTEEKGFHDWLDAADHRRSRPGRSGREWFLTTTRFLDRVARERGLPVTVVNEMDVPPE